MKPLMTTQAATFEKRDVESAPLAGAANHFAALPCSAQRFGALAPGNERCVEQAWPHLRRLQKKG